MSTPSYFGIRIGSLPPGVPLPFDLYVRVGEKLIRYLNSGDSLEAEKLQKLTKQDTGHFFISEDQKWTYRQFMSQLLASSKLGLEEKAHLLKESALSFVEDIFEKPNVHQALDESKPIIQTFVQYLENEPEVLAQVIELSSHDFYTYNHSLDVSIYALGLGQVLGFQGTELEDLGLGALFHDVGKRLVPPEILCKKGGLNDQEWEIMQQHPQFGLELLIEKPNISEGILAACFEHHESYSGTGYPRKLKGEEIHPFGRIVAIVDTFDAMTTQRSYNTPLTPEQALLTMRDQLKGRYDPQMIQAMTEVLFSLNPRPSS